MTSLTGVSTTALLVNESRARRPGLSRDHLARDWIPAPRRAAVRQLWEGFSGSVYAHDALVCAVRGRLVLETIEAAVSDHGPVQLVNVGAGFTSYPYLAEVAGAVELDLPRLTAAKRRRTQDLVAAGRLPADRAARVAHLAVDLGTDRGIEVVSDTLATATTAGPTVLVVEGLLYYLSGARCAELLQVVSQHRDQVAATVLTFWPTTAREHRVLGRQERWFARTGVPPSTTLLEIEAVSDALGPRVEHLDLEQQQQLVGEHPVIPEAQLIPEHLARSRS